MEGFKIIFLYNLNSNEDWTKNNLKNILEFILL